LLSFIQYKSDNGDDDQGDNDPHNQTCETTFAELRPIVSLISK